VNHILWIWLRRGTAARAFPALVAAEIVLSFSRNGWNHEWDWALSWATFGMATLAPLIAGLVAFDRARRVEPTLAHLTSATPRGWFGDIALVLAGWLSAVAVWVVGVAVVVTRSALGGATGWPDPWIFIEGPVLLLLSVCVGIAVGSTVGGLLAGPLAAIGLYLAQSFVSSIGSLEPLSAGGATGSLLGLQRNPVNAMSVIGFHLSVIVLALTVQVARRRRMWFRGVTAGLAGVLVVVTWTVMGAVGGEAYRWTALPRVCLPGEVTVCGPSNADYVLRAAQRSLETALTELDDSGIDWQQTYVLLDGKPVPAGQGELTVATETMEGDSLGRENLLMTLETPRLCRALFSDRPPERLMDASGTVMDWLDGRLYGQVRGPAPEAVRQAYEELRICEPMTDPLP
jgi:hypothetical protein